MIETYLAHHGILGQRWGIRRYQNKDGTLTPLGRKRLLDESGRLNEKGREVFRKADDKFLNSKEVKRVHNQLEKESRKEVEKFVKQEFGYIPKKNKNGKNNLNYVHQYNKKLAEVMNRNVKDLPSPSGMVLRFVADRSDYGVINALAGRGFDMTKVKNGIYSDGRIAYKKEKVGTI